MLSTLKKKPAIAISAACLGALAVGGAFFFLRPKRRVAQRVELPLMTKAECEKRRRIVSGDVSYSVQLLVPPVGHEYSGLVTIRFELNTLEDLSLNYQKAGLTSLVINGITVDRPSELLSNEQIMLSKDLLQLGENVIDVSFTALYDREPVGLEHFEDGDSFSVTAVAHSQLASRIFPCFDQPDMKCKIKLQVIIPRSFRAVSNEKIVEERNLEQGELTGSGDPSVMKRVEFLQTKKLPVQSFFLGVGQFESHKLPTTFKSIPVTLHYRKAKEDQVTQLSEAINKVVVKTLDFFSAKLGLKYPFSKIDLFFGKTGASAVSNPGCFLLSESLLDALLASPYQITEAFLIIVRVIVQVWFGCLVSCEFWDDVFFHDSMASFLSLHILETIQSAIGRPLLDLQAFSVMSRARDSFLAAALPSASAVKFVFEPVELSNSSFKGIVSDKGGLQLASIAKVIGLEQFLEAIKTLLSQHLWDNINFKSFVKSFNREDQQVICRQLLTTGVSVFRLESTGSEDEVHVTSVGFSNPEHLEGLEVAQYNKIGERTVLRPALAIPGNAAASLKIARTEGFFVFNAGLGSFSLYIDEPFNYRRVIDNASSLNVGDACSYFFNLCNVAVIKGEDCDRVFEFFKAAFHQLSQADLALATIMLKRVVISKASTLLSASLASQAFNFLVEKGEFEAALDFATGPEQLAVLGDALRTDPKLVSTNTWKRFVSLLSKDGVSQDTSEILSASDQQRLNELVEACNSSNIDFTWTSTVVFRSGYKSDSEYEEVARFVKNYLPEQQYLAQLKSLVRRLPLVAEKVSKYYAVRLIQWSVPDYRLSEGAAELRVELISAQDKLRNKPLVQAALISATEKFDIFNS